jgi:hypothetical protein
MVVNTKGFLVVGVDGLIRFIVVVSVNVVVV